MEFKVKCIKNYTPKGEELFVEGRIYTLVVNNLSGKTRVMYGEHHGTQFLGSLDEYFKPSTSRYSIWCEWVLMIYTKL